MIAKPKKHSGMKAICGSDLGAVITPGPARSPKKEGFFTKAKAVIFDGKSPTDAGRSRTPPKPSNGSSYASYPPNNPSGGGASVTLPRLPKQEDHRNQPASSSHGDRNGSKHSESYQIRPPPPGSYQDDDTGPSPKNLMMAVMGVKSAVNHFAKVLISDMSKHPEELRHLEQLIRRELQADVDRANHWKFLVQAFVCKRLFEGFETKNGFFGIEYFDGSKMSFISSFMDFTKFKDKAVTISELLAKQSEDESFLGKYCFKKFKLITGDVATNQPLPMYEEDWSMVERERHPQSEFYQSFLKVAVSVWLLHRLVYSFEQGWSLLGWETFPKGSKFQRKSMESVVPGGFEEEDEETGTDVSAVVGFLVIPGFQVSKSVVKCEVYLPNKNDLNDGKIMEATGVPSGDKPLEDLFSDKRLVSYSQIPEKSYISPASHQTSEKSYTNSATHQTPEKSYTGSASHQTSEKSYTGPASHQTSEKSNTRPASHQTPEKSYTGSTNHQTSEKSYTNSATHQTPEKSYTSPASHQTPEKSNTRPASHQTPEKSYTNPASHQTPEKSYTNPASHQTPEKSYTNPASHQTPEKSYTNSASHQTSEKSNTRPASHQTLEKSYTNSASHQTSEKSYTNPASHQTPEKSYTNSASHQTSEKSNTRPASHQIPEKSYTRAAGHPTLEKSYISPANHQAPEKGYTSAASLSHASLRGLQTTESFRSTTNHSGRSSRSAADKEAAKYWTDPQTRESLGNSTHRSKNDQSRSSLGRSTGQLESKGRALTTHILPMAPSPSAKQSASRPPGYVARHNFLSRQRAASNKRTV